MLLGERAVIKSWTGIEDVGSGITDYEKACSHDDFIWILSVEGGDVAIIGDMPNSMTVISKSPVEVWIVRWGCAESMADMTAALAVIDLAGVRPEIGDVRLKLHSGDLVMFGSALSAAYVENYPSALTASSDSNFVLGNSIEFQMAIGELNVATYSVTVEGTVTAGSIVEVLIHKLTTCGPSD